MSHNSHISDEEMTFAGELMSHPNHKVRSVAAALMRFGQNRPPLGAEPVLSRLDTLAHANRAMGLFPRNGLARRVDAAETIVGGGKPNRLLDLARRS